MKKKIFLLFVMSVFLFTLTACGSEKNNEELVNELVDNIKEEINSKEKSKLANAQKEVISEVGVDKVYWSKDSKKYHSDPDCPAISQAATIYEGTVADAFERGVNDPCRRCIHELN